MCVHDILFILFIYQQINLMNKTIFNKRASLKFSHFSNKGYSLFSVLGRVVAIGALSVTTLTYAKAEGISVEGAKADSVFIRGGKAYELDGVTVTGARAPMTVELSPKIVTVMTREDIQRSAAQRRFETGYGRGCASAWRFRGADRHFDQRWHLRPDCNFP